MRMYNMIVKKRNGGELADQEIQAIIDGYVGGIIPDYQMSALLMAIYFQGMTNRELGTLTMAMAKSGDMVDLSSIDGIKVQWIKWNPSRACAWRWMNKTFFVRFVK